MSLNLGVARLQLWSCKWFASSWDVVANPALKTTGRIQLLQGNSDPWLLKEKSQQVPLRLLSEWLQVRTVCSLQLTLQQHSCKL